jgi:hypothetical protein
LLLHGAVHDNGHAKFTHLFAHELQKANKPFEMMIYPTACYGIFGRH